MRRFARRVLEVGPLARIREARYRRAFSTGRDGWPRFFGLFRTREEAEAAAPPSRPLGYDHPEVAEVNRNLMASVWTSDYPAIYWLRRALENQDHVFDLGGHTATKYHAWAPYLDLSDEATWTVCDLPAMVAAGEKLCAGIPRVRFTTDHGQMEGAGILLASGVLQYMEPDLEHLLAACRRPPPHLILNKVPTRAGPDVFTLENLRKSTVAYRIFQESRLLGVLEALGYRLLDRWDVHESSVRVPFSDLGEPIHRGYALERTSRG